MPGLTVFTSNRLENLSAQLARIVRIPLRSPLSPETIVVQSRGMQRWLSMQLARHNTICAHTVFPFPNGFLEDIFTRMVDPAETDPLFSPGVLTFRIMKILPHLLDRTGFESLKSYLEGEPRQLKRFQLSAQIAQTYDHYLIYRPDLIFAWEDSSRKTISPRDSDEIWQADLWRRLVEETAKNHIARQRQRLFEVLANQNIPPERLPERVSVFGISHLPPFYLDVLAALAQRIPVNLFVMNPCREYWADIVSSAEMERFANRYNGAADARESLHLEQGNPLLASMGQMGRDFFAYLNGLDLDIASSYREPQTSTLLTAVQADILNLRDRVLHPAPAAADPSICIHACHSPMREVEVLYDQLLGMFEEIPDLHPEEIVIMAPEIETYAPYVEAVFGAVQERGTRIPYQIADRDDRGKRLLVDGLLSLLDVKGSRLGVSETLARLEFPAIRERFGLKEDEIEIVSKWIAETGIRWEEDGRSRTRWGVPPEEQNTWRAGLDRMLLGYAMPGEERYLFDGILPYDYIEGGSAEILGNFLDFIYRLFALRKSLETPHRAGEWRRLLLEILDDFFLLDDAREAELQQVRTAVETVFGCVQTAGYQDELTFEVVYADLRNALCNPSGGQSFMSGGVTFCALMPMRSVPFKVTGLLGMNADAFPRQSRSVSFDLMEAHPRPGDRSRRNDDKYLFLEALLSARCRLYISYIGQSMQDNSPMMPSVLVSELLEYLQQGFGVPPEQIVNHHPLQPFSPRYFQADGKLFSFSRENFTASRKLIQPEPVRPFFDTPLPSPTPEWRQTSLGSLIEFFKHPARFLLEKRLSVYLRDHEAEPVVGDRENFDLEGLDRYLLGTDLAEALLTGSDPEDQLPIWRAEGLLPHGDFGKEIFRQIYQSAVIFVDRIRKHISPNLFAPLDFQLQVGGFDIQGCLAYLHPEAQLCRHFAKFKGRYLLKAWIQHLVLCSAAKEPYPTTSLSACKDQIWAIKFVCDPMEILLRLIQLYWKGLQEPLCFFPEAGFVYADMLLNRNASESEAFKAADRVWRGNQFYPGESDDPYYEKCFGNRARLTAAFRETATAVYSDLLAHAHRVA